MNTEKATPPKKGPAGPQGAPKRMSGMLMISLFLSVGFLMMPLLLLIGPLLGGILAFFGWRKVKRDPTLIGPRFALTCMVLAVLSFGFQAYLVVRDLPVVMFSRSISTTVTSLHTALEAREFEHIHELGTDAFRESREAADLTALLSPLFPGDGSLPDPEDWFGNFADPRVDALGITVDGAKVVAASPYLWSPGVVWDLGGDRVDSEFGQDVLPVGAVAVSGDGRRVLTARHGGGVVVWDALEARKIGGFAGHEGPVTAAALSDDGRIALTVSRTGEAVVWKPAAEGADHVFPRHEAPLAAAAVSRDGKKGLAGGVDGTVKVYDLVAGTEIASFRPVETLPRPLGFLPGEERLYAGTGLGLAILEVSSGEKVVEIAGGGKPVRCALVLDGGRRIVTGSEDGAVRLWDVETGREVRLVDELDDPVTCLALAGNGRVLGAATSGAEVRTYDWPEDDGPDEIDIGEAGKVREARRQERFARDGEGVLSFVPRFHMDVGGAEVELVVRFEIERLGRIDFETRIADLHAFRLSDFEVAVPPEGDAPGAPAGNGDSPEDGQDEPR